MGKNKTTSRRTSTPNFGFIETDLVLDPGLALVRYAGLGEEPKPMVQIDEKGRIRGPSMDTITTDDDGVIRLRRYPIQGFGRNGKPRAFGPIQVRDIVIGDRPFVTIEHLDSWGPLQREIQAAIKDMSDLASDVVPGMGIFAPPFTNGQKVDPGTPEAFSAALAAGRMVSVKNGRETVQGRALYIGDLPKCKVHPQGVFLAACKGWETVTKEALSKATTTGQEIFMPEITGRAVEAAQTKAKAKAVAEVSDQEAKNNQLASVRAEWRELVDGLKGLSDDQRKLVNRLNPVGMVRAALEGDDTKLTKLDGIGPAKAAKILDEVLTASVSWTANYSVLFASLSPTPVEAEVEEASAS